MTAREMAKRIIQDVWATSGITATAGIGTNLYLAKIAMDIVAKHVKADADGVRIAELNETNYRQLLWDHRPLTDFWRIGRGIAKRLEKNGLYTMGDVARMSLQGADTNGLTRNCSLTTPGGLSLVPWPTSSIISPTLTLFPPARCFPMPMILKRDG